MDIDIQNLSQYEKDKLLLDTVCQEQEDLAKVKELIAAGAYINTFSTYHHMSGLMHAICEHHYNIARFFIEQNNIKLSMQTYYGDQTALILAVEYNSPIDIIQRLIEKGSDINKKAAFQKTALMLSIELNRPIEIIQLLINKGANLQDKDFSGNTALDIAIKKKKSIEVIHCLLSAMSYTDIEHFSQASTENTEIVHELLKRDREKLFSIILLHQLEWEKISDPINYMKNLLTVMSSSFSIENPSKWYLASPLFEQDICSFITDIKLKQEIPKSPVIFSIQPNSKESRKKSCSQMVYEGLSVAKNNFLSLFFDSAQIELKQENGYEEERHEANVKRRKRDLTSS